MYLLKNLCIGLIVVSTIIVIAAVLFTQYDYMPEESTSVPVGIDYSDRYYELLNKKVITEEESYEILSEARKVNEENIKALGIEHRLTDEYREILKNNYEEEKRLKKIIEDKNQLK